MQRLSGSPPIISTRRLRGAWKTPTTRVGEPPRPIAPAARPQFSQVAQPTSTISFFPASRMPKMVEFSGSG